MSSDFIKTFDEVTNEAMIFFDKINALNFEEAPEEKFFSLDFNTEHFWNQLPIELQENAINIEGKLLNISGKLAVLIKNSALAGTEDLHDIKLATKTMRAALHLRNYHYQRLNVVHDEGRVLGVNEAEQSEDFPTSPKDAKKTFEEKARIINKIISLAQATPSFGNISETASSEKANKYIAGTAFIMMWMSKENPELTDVLDKIKHVCAKFDIKANRADDIEHEGQITNRILDEIKSAEFLFADLTGMRPNVYYEVGYAHALGKRVILFRKNGTGIHFDLAGYNCPEYENLRELEDILIKRLVHITNKKPNE